MATLSTLKRRAEKYGMTIRKHERGEDSYSFVEKRTALAIEPYPLPLELIERWLDNLDNEKADIVTRKVFKVNNPDDDPFVGIAEPF